MDLLPTSKGEVKVIALLLCMNIPFFREMPVEVEGGRVLYLDFFIPERNLVVEYDGKQHTKAVRRFGGARGRDLQRERDHLKDSHCKGCGREVLRISYLSEISGLRKLAECLNPQFDFDGWVEKFNGRMKKSHATERRKVVLSPRAKAQVQVSEASTSGASEIKIPSPPKIRVRPGYDVKPWELFVKEQIKWEGQVESEALRDAFRAWCVEHGHPTSSEPLNKTSTMWTKTAKDGRLLGRQVQVTYEKRNTIFVGLSLKQV